MSQGTSKMDMDMSIGFFQASIKDGKPNIKSDAVFRAFIRQFEGYDVELIIRPKIGDKYSFLTPEWKKSLYAFFREADATEAAAIATWAVSGYDSIDIVRRLAADRLKAGKNLSQEIVDFFALSGKQNVLFGDTPESKRSVERAVSA